MSTLSAFGKFENTCHLEKMSKYKYRNLQEELQLFAQGVTCHNKVNVIAKDLPSKPSGEASRLAEESTEVLPYTTLMVYVLFAIN